MPVAPYLTTKFVAKQGVFGANKVTEALGCPGIALFAEEESGPLRPTPALAGSFSLCGRCSCVRYPLALS